MTNGEIRSWYQKQVAEITKHDAAWIKQGIGLEERARGAWSIRRGARIQARSMMENPAEVEDLKRRDLRLYGNPDGPTFDQLVTEYEQKGLKRDEIYERIIKGAGSTNPAVDRLFDKKDPG